MTGRVAAPDCTRCGSVCDPGCLHEGEVCCACADLELRQLFGMLGLDSWPDAEAGPGLR